MRHPGTCVHRALSVGRNPSVAPRKRTPARPRSTAPIAGRPRSGDFVCLYPPRVHSAFDRMTIRRRGTMNPPDLASHRSLHGFLVSAALGAAAMYVLDPDKGRRRRALARDKVRSLVTDSGELLSAAARDARFRAQGL